MTRAETRAVVRDRCPTCGDPLVGAGPDCIACARLSIRFHKIYDRGQGHGDSDYAMHELAHCVLILNRRPHGMRDMRVVQSVLDQMSMGRAQRHEMRTIRLQHEAYRMACLASNLRRHLGLVWQGMQDVVNEQAGGEPIVKTEAHALRIARTLKPSVRKARLLAGMYIELRA